MMQLTVKISLARLGNSASSFLFILLNNTNLLEGLHNLAVNRAGGIDVLGGAGATILGASVNLPEATDTDSFAKVNMASD